MNGWLNDINAPSWEEFMASTTHTWAEKMLVQAIARISAIKGFRDMSPEEIYLMLLEQTEKVHSDR